MGRTPESQRRFDEIAARINEVRPIDVHWLLSMLVAAWNEIDNLRRQFGDEEA